MLLLYLLISNFFYRFIPEILEMLMLNYSKASTNLKSLEDGGCTILHGVDACTMSHHPLLFGKSFDRIVFNFPHAGFLFPEHDCTQIE